MGPHYLRTVRKHIYGRKEPPKSPPTPFSRCFEGMPAFALPLVLLRLFVNLLAFPNSGFSLLRRVYTFGLDGPSRIHSDPLSRGRDSRKRSFERSRVNQFGSLSLASLNPSLLKCLVRNGFSQVSEPPVPCDSARAFPF